MRIKKPDLENKQQQINQQIEQYCEKIVRPYLVYLLEKAQERLWRHKLGFVQGMGSWCFTIDNTRFENEFNMAFSTDEVAYRQKHGKSPFTRQELMLRERLPWLVEFMEIIETVDDYWNHCFGDIET